jgi:hypothetical protein
MELGDWYVRGRKVSDNSPNASIPFVDGVLSMWCFLCFLVDYAACRSEVSTYFWVAFEIYWADNGRVRRIFNVETGAAIIAIAGAR